MKCEHCGIDIRKGLRFCSRSCVASWHNKNRWKDPEYRAKRSAYVSAQRTSQNNAKWSNPEYVEHMKVVHKKLSTFMKKRWKTREWRERMQPVLSKNGATTYPSNCSGRRIEIETRFGVFRARSAMEARLIGVVASLSQVKHLLYEAVRVTYSFENKVRIYLPDLFVVTRRHTYVIELKPYYLVNDALVKAKAKAARRVCREHNASFVILTDKMLDRYSSIIV